MSASLRRVFVAVSLAGLAVLSAATPPGPRPSEPLAATAGLPPTRTTPQPASHGPVPDAVRNAYRGVRLTSAVADAWVKGQDNRLRVRPARYGGPWLAVSSHPFSVTAGEPTLGVTRQGTVFVYAARYLPVTDGHLVASRDGGATWSSAGALPADTDPPVTQDPFLWVDPDTGRVFTVDLVPRCFYLTYSDDDGATWSRNPLACAESSGHDHQSLVTGRPPKGVRTNSYRNVVYLCYANTAARCERSLDGGQTFTAGPDVMSSPEAGCPVQTGHAATDPDGRVFLPKLHCGAPTVAISADAVKTWSVVRITKDPRLTFSVPGDGAHDASVAADSTGNLYAVWSSTPVPGGSGRTFPFLAVSRDHGRTWSDPLMVAPPGVTQVGWATLTAGDTGRIAITFPGTTGDPADAGRPWNAYVVTSVDALAADPLFVSTTANARTDPIHRGDCPQPRCPGMLDFWDVVVSPKDGSLWLSFVDTCLAAGCLPQGITDPMVSPWVGEGVAAHQVSGPSLWRPGRRR